MEVGYNPNKDPWDTATQWGEELISAKAGDRPGASGQILQRLNLRGHGSPRATKVEEGRPCTQLSKRDPSPTRHLALTHTQESVGRKTTKAIFHARGVGHREKSEPLCMTCQIAEARKCLGRGLRCEPGRARSPRGTRRQCALVIGAFQSEGRKQVRGILPPPHGRDELVTRPWPDRPAPGREPGCPEMSPRSLQGSGCFPLLVVWAGGSPKTPFL